MTQATARRWIRGSQRTSTRRTVRALGLDLGSSEHRLCFDGRDQVFSAPPEIRSAWGTSPSPFPRVMVSPSLPHILREAVSPARRLGRRGFSLAVATPAGLGGHQRQQVIAAARNVTQGQPVLLMESALAAASGAAFDITGEHPSLIVDIGVRRTEVVAVARGQVLGSVSLGVGCRHLERAVVALAYDQHRIVASPRDARRWMGNTQDRDAPQLSDPIAVAIGTSELHGALSQPLGAVVHAIREFLRNDHLPSEGSIPLLVHGGGALLAPVVATFTCDLPAVVVTPPDPRRAVIRGMRLLLDETRHCPELWRTA